MAIDLFLLQSSRGDEGQRRAVNPYPVLVKWHVSGLAAGLPGFSGSYRHQSVSGLPYYCRWKTQGMRNANTLLFSCFLVMPVLAMDSWITTPMRTGI